MPPSEVLYSKSMEVVAVGAAAVGRMPIGILPAGTGSETRSGQQVAMMQKCGATVSVGFADYIKHLAYVAREQGLEPGRDIPIRMISGHMGREAVEMLSESWGGAAVFDWYGVGDTGAIAGQGRIGRGSTSMKMHSISKYVTSKPEHRLKTGNLAT